MSNPNHQKVMSELFAFLNRDLDPAYQAQQKAQGARNIEAHNAQLAQRQQEEDAFNAQLDSAQFRQEVIAELVADGIAQQVAEQLTSSRAGLHKQAVKYDLI